MKQEIESIALEIFSSLKKESLENDPKCVAANSIKTIEINNITFHLSVECYWDKSDWFEYHLENMKGECILEGVTWLN